MLDEADKYSDEIEILNFFEFFLKTFIFQKIPHIAPVFRPRNLTEALKYGIIIASEVEGRSLNSFLLFCYLHSR